MYYNNILVKLSLIYYIIPILKRDSESNKSLNFYPAIAGFQMSLINTPFVKYGNTSSN